MKKIRGILLLTFATGMVAILSACGSEAPPPPPPPPAQPTAAQVAAESSATEAPAAMMSATTQPAADPTDAPAMEKPATATP